MTDEQLEKLAEEYERSENQTGYYERIKEDYTAGARAVRDEMQKEVARIQANAVITIKNTAAELERVKEQCNIGHINVHSLNEQITDLQQRLERVNGENVKLKQYFDEPGEGNRYRLMLIENDKLKVELERVKGERDEMQKAQNQVWRANDVLHPIEVEELKAELERVKGELEFYKDRPITPRDMLQSRLNEVEAERDKLEASIKEYFVKLFM